MAANNTTVAHLVMVLRNFLPVIGNVGYLFAWNHFGRNLVALVESSTHVNGRPIGIIAGVHGIWRNARIRCRLDPSDALAWITWMRKSWIVNAWYWIPLVRWIVAVAFVKTIDGNKRVFHI